MYGPGASVGQDLEPEYVAISPNSSLAWVSLQENNGIAFIQMNDDNNDDNDRNNLIEISQLFGLGYKNCFESGNGFDGSDRDGGIHIYNWPVCFFIFIFLFYLFKLNLIFSIYL